MEAFPSEAIQPPLWFSLSAFACPFIQRFRPRLPESIPVPEKRRSREPESFCEKMRTEPIADVKGPGALAADDDTETCLSISFRPLFMSELRSIMAKPVAGKARIPIVAVAANVVGEEHKAAPACGMNGHPAKPYDIPGIMDTLNKLPGKPRSAGTPESPRRRAAYAPETKSQTRIPARTRRQR